jgi:hypothetical protein
MRNRQAYDSSPRYGEGEDTLTSLPPSPPPLKSVMFGPPPPSQHRRASSYMEYTDRTDLFGSSPPFQSSSPFPLMSSRALARMEERRLNGFTTPDKTSFSNSVARIEGEDANLVMDRPFREGISSDRAMAMSIPDMRLRSDALEHAASFREKFGNEGSRTSTALNLRSSRSDSRSSAMSLRDRFTNSPRNEWTQAGSPEQELTGGGYGSEPTSSDRPFALTQHRSSTSIAQSQVSTKASLSPSTNGNSEKTCAALALRQNLVASKTLKSSWTDKLFSRREPSTPRQAPGSPFSDENVSEFGYVKPQSPTESPETILARIRARGAALEDDAREALDGDLPESDFGNLFRSHTEDNGQEGDRASSPAESLRSLDPLFPGEDESNVELATLIASTDHLSVTSDSVEECNATSVGSENPQFVQIPESNLISVPSNSLISLSSTFVAFESAPELPHIDRPMSRAPMEQSQISPPHKLALSAVETILVQQPLAPIVRRSLSFATANSIIYGSMSFAALYFILAHIGETARGVDMGHDVGVGFLVGIMIVVVLHLTLGGRIQQIAAKMARSVSKGIGAVARIVVGGFREGRQA